MKKQSTDSVGKLGWLERVAIIGSAASLLGLVPVFIVEGAPARLRIVLGVGLGLCLILLFRRIVVRHLKSVHGAMEFTTPWAVAVILCLSGAILSMVWSPKKAGVILFESGRGAIFNSSDHVTNHTRFIQAFGSSKGTLGWMIDEDGRAASFKYEADLNIRPSGLESSGAYYTFYDEAYDRHAIRSIRFECRATEFQGQPDVGVRVAVDDPHAAGDRELRTLEFASLAPIGRINGEWREFNLNLSDFKEVVLRPPFPKGLDANTLNKIAFYVNAQTASNCPKATLRFRGVSFEK